LTVASTTTLPPTVKIAPVTRGGVPWMNAGAIAVAPAAMSPPSLSKSNCASSPMVVRAGAVAVWPPEIARAR